MSGLLSIGGVAEPTPGLEFSDDLAEFERLTTVDEMVRAAREVVPDPTFPTVRAWTRSGRGAVGCFPVYTPQEIVHAMGMLPVTLQGGGEAVEIAHADAALGSFLCSISKSTLELGLTGRLDPFRAFVFPYICDVSRNLEGIFARVLPGRPSHMLHLPQNFASAATVPFLAAEYRRLIGKLEKAGGTPPTEESLRASFALFATHRAAMAELARVRSTRPWDLSLAEYYLIGRLANLLPRELHLRLLRRALADLAGRARSRKDSVRVVVVGSFCEQPTLDLLELVEEVGCYAVDDELAMLHRWYARVESRSDALTDLASAYVRSAVDIGVRATPTTKGAAILERVERAQATAVLFLTAKFCEPALEDVVLYRRALEAKKIPYLHLEFEEKSSAYEQSRLQLETFVESILFD